MRKIVTVIFGMLVFFFIIGSILIYAVNQKIIYHHLLASITLGFILIGAIPLLTFLFSLFKQSLFTKKLLWFFLVPGFFSLVALILGTWAWTHFEDTELGALILISPPVPALLMSLSGTRALADRCPSWIGIPLSIFNALGCVGLTLGILLMYFPKIYGESQLALAIVAALGGGITTVISMVFALAAWKRRLARKLPDNEMENNKKLLEEILGRTEKP